MSNFNPNNRLCLCGCKETVKKNNKYIHGHNARVQREWIEIGHNYNTGKKCSEDKKNRISKSLMGHEVPSEQRIKQSNTRKKLFREGKLIHGMLGRKGILSSNYIDGRSCKEYPREFNNELKEFIRNRDSYICQNCEMLNEEHLIVLGYDLTIHHIDYNKENNKKDNLIALCSWCNIRANYNRNYWENLYKEKIQTTKV